MEGIKKAMNGGNLKEGQWEDREQWSLGVGQEDREQRSVGVGQEDREQWSLGVGQRRKSFETGDDDDVRLYVRLLWPNLLLYVL
jgi:hypothetical protein